jgi:ABC-2 type transport system ATP-binding protein
MAHQEIAVIVKDLYKSFRLPHEQSSGVKQSIINFARRKKGYETQHVLKDISFEIKKGEFFGIVGRNGSGKSTLLKLLAGIYVPDKGLVQLSGSLTPFIELGVGFNPELTGRENVFMNGALLGFSKKEVESMYDDIVEFAEIEKFMDQKLKNYSSGMQVRLAFSIAIRAETDILLFDEVIAVGDAAFQQKCYETFAEMKKKGTTIILVTHDMSAVQRFCDRALFLDKGKIKNIGDPLDIADRYLEDNFEKKGNQDRHNEKIKQPSIKNVKLTNGKKSLDIYESVEIYFEVEPITNNKYHIGFQIFRTDGVYVYGGNSKIEKLDPFFGFSQHTIHFEQNLAPGTYTVTLAVMNEAATSIYEYIPKSAQFTIKQQTNIQGVVLLNYKWRASNV